jgi:hypothetical protein
LNIIPLIAVTMFFVIGVVGTVGKLLFDDWRARQALRKSFLPDPLLSKLQAGK